MVIRIGCGNRAHIVIHIVVALERNYIKVEGIERMILVIVFI